MARKDMYDDFNLRKPFGLLVYTFGLYKAMNDIMNDNRPC